VTASEGAERFIDPEHQPEYLDIPELVELIDEPYREACQRIIWDHEGRMKSTPGSSGNHQAWEGGYWDHVRECMNMASVYYDVDSSLRPLPFSKSDALLILFLHDLEKPWRFERQEDETKENPDLRTKPQKRAYREKMLKRYDIKLSSHLENAFIYAEGELDAYSNENRAMNELAVFCHTIDYKSARQWHDYPQLGDPWSGAGRVVDQEPTSP
jgi:hypothetical protein